MKSKRDRINTLFSSELVVINVGLEHFYDSLIEQGIKAVHVNIQRAPSLNKRLSDALDKIL